MTNPTGFLEIDRRDRPFRPAKERLESWAEFVEPLPSTIVAAQAERCMDCGIPFCHQACPLNNLIPDWNDLVTADDWRAALDRLHATNNFPEFTGRVCPAPCEAACTLNIQDAPVTIKTIECAIADRACEEGWMKPHLASRGTGKRIAIVGSGPAGLACAQQLARIGHNVTVFEKADRLGGLLRYGIPDFKMEKRLIDRRVDQMMGEGVLFRTGVHVGVDLSMERMLDNYEVVVLAGGAEQPRDLAIPGRDLPGIHFAMDYLVQQNRRNAGLPELGEPILATGRHVVVIGGGDTGSDCIGTANRQGAASVTQLEIMPEPPLRENKALTWPYWPLKLRTSSSQEEGCERDFSITTTAFSGKDRVERLHCARVEPVAAPGSVGRMDPVEGSAFGIKANLVLLAMGFNGTPVGGIADRAQVERAPNGAVAAQFGHYETSRERIFACGDMRRGQSLVVWAVREGRDCAVAVNAFLTA